MFLNRNSEDVSVSAANFSYVVQWGNLRSNYLEGLLRLVGGIYAPMFFKNVSWPDSIKNDFSSHLHRWNMLAILFWFLIITQTLFVWIWLMSPIFVSFFPPTTELTWPTLSLFNIFARFLHIARLEASLWCKPSLFISSSIYLFNVHLGNSLLIQYSDLYQLLHLTCCFSFFST